MTNGLVTGANLVLRSTAGGDSFDPPINVGAGATVEIEFSAASDDGSNWLYVRVKTDQGDKFGFLPTANVVVAAPSPTDPRQWDINHLLRIRFDSAQAIENFFQAVKMKGFSRWFNSDIAHIGAWSVKNKQGQEIGPQISLSNNAANNYENVWNQYCKRQADGQISLVRFLSYCAIFINETGGTFNPGPEGYNRIGDDPPGIAYLFNEIGHKHSYNVYDDPANPTPHLHKTAGQCFRDLIFSSDAVHGKLGGKHLIDLNTQDWDGVVYPFEKFADRVMPSANIEYILQTDFFKFRGRGFIQTTWRDNYAAFIKYATNGQSIKSDAMKAFIVAVNACNGPDDFCTRSTYQQWDALFTNSDLEAVMLAIEKHASDGGYLPSDMDAGALQGQGPGSLFLMGQKIGGKGYGPIFKPRVMQMINALGKL